MKSLHFKFSAYLLIICFLALAQTVFAQDSTDHRAPLAEGAPGQAPGVGANLAFEPVGIGDLLYVYVADSPEATRSYRVSPSGTIAVAMLPKPVAVDGQLPSAIEGIISKALVDAHILVQPVVSVAVVEYRSRPVAVVGAVRHPLTLQALGGLRLLDAISRADGLDTNAGPEIVVTRPGQEPLKISTKVLIAGADPSLNIVLKGGEEVRVPEAGKFFIVGNVKSPGTYPVNEVDGTTVLKALAACQGLLPYTRKEGYVYRTLPGSTTRQEIPVPVDSILHRRAPDFPLMANDVLYLPDNSGKRTSMGVLDRLAGFGGQTASGLLIWH